MAVSIRKAGRGDAATLGKLGAMLMRTHYAFDPKRFLPAAEGTEQGYGSFLSSMIESDEDCVFVAEDNGAIAGYVWGALEPLSWKELRGPAGFIHDVAVLEPFRGKGIGTQLMKTAVEWLREHGAPRVILWTAAPNAGAQALFHRLGFRETMYEMTMEL